VDWVAAYRVARRTLAPKGVPDFVRIKSESLPE
jgi:hypothetical protein